jgi:hypothetical protein
VKLIGATGKAGSGKDTLALGLADELEFNYNFEIYHFADPIKKALNVMFGWTMDQWDDREWKETPVVGIEKSPRQLAQTLGTEWGRHLVDRDLWLKIAMERYMKFREYSASVPLPHNLYGEPIESVMIVPDVRFANEAYWICKEGGTVIEVSRGSPDTESLHLSEAGVPDEYITHSIVNDGTIDEMIVKGIKLCGL